MYLTPEHNKQEGVVNYTFTTLYRYVGLSRKRVLKGLKIIDETTRSFVFMCRGFGGRIDISVPLLCG